jgi:hypothetical protein
VEKTSTQKRNPPKPQVLRTPIQIHDLTMIFVLLVEAAKFKTRTIGKQSRVNPSVGPTFLKQVCNRRKIDQAQSARIMRYAPAMCVTVEVCFDVAARTQNFHQFRRVLQRPGCGSEVLQRGGRADQFCSSLQCAIA